MNKFLIAALGIVLTLVIVDAYPISGRQFLPRKPGYVPVYIRNGDTPLEEINLDLAEAFHAIPSGRSAGRLNKSPRLEEEEKKEVKPIQADVIEEKKEDKEVVADVHEPITELKINEEVKAEQVEEDKKVDPVLDEKVNDVTVQ